MESGSKTCEALGARSGTLGRAGVELRRGDVAVRDSRGVDREPADAWAPFAMESRTEIQNERRSERASGSKQVSPEGYWLSVQRRILPQP
jgi:hypothetical protein